MDSLQMQQKVGGDHLQQNGGDHLQSHVNVQQNLLDGQEATPDDHGKGVHCEYGDRPSSSKDARPLPVSSLQSLCIFGESVDLPKGCCITNALGKITEVEGCYFADDIVSALRKKHPSLLIDVVDGVLEFQMPSSSATDIVHLFEGQIKCYLARRGISEDMDTASSSSLFHVPGRSQRVCADFTLFSRRGYKEKVVQARAQGRTVPSDVQVFLTVEMQSWSQSEDYIRSTCATQASWLQCVSIAMLVKTGWIEIYTPNGRAWSQFNPRYIDVGAHSMSLPGLRLYLEPFREKPAWCDYPRYHNLRMSIPRSADDLVSAIKLEDFELAEEVLHYFFPFDGADSQGERPLVLAVEKAIQGIPHAHQLVDYLLRNGANPNVKDFEGISPWLAAVGNATITDLLLQHGAQAEELSPEALVSAVVGRKKKLVSLLMRAGCDVNLADQDGMLPLVAALPSIEMVTTILDMVNEINQGGNLRVHSAIKCAKQYGHKEILKLLKAAGGRKRSHFKMPGFHAIVKKITSKKTGKRKDTS